MQQAYLSILYLRVPENFCMMLRGKCVQYHSIANDLKFPEFILYKPQSGGCKEVQNYFSISFLFLWKYDDHIQLIPFVRRLWHASWSYHNFFDSLNTSCLVHWIMWGYFKNVIFRCLATTTIWDFILNASAESLSHPILTPVVSTYIFVAYSSQIIKHF